MADKPTSTLERAFGLARGGRYETFTDIVAALEREGVAKARDELAGESIRYRINALIAERRDRPAA